LIPVHGGETHDAMFVHLPEGLFQRSSIAR
jgi:hypothetical protein